MTARLDSLRHVYVKGIAGSYGTFGIEYSHEAFDFMYTYHQSTGVLAQNGVQRLTGYAGHGAGVNNPGMQEQHDVGPLPRGRYAMTALIDSPHTGLATIILDPDPTNQMFGRSGFRIHGDNAAANHTASDGCIIAGHAADRTTLWKSGDHDLEVLI